VAVTSPLPPVVFGGTSLLPANCVLNVSVSAEAGAPAAIKQAAPNSARCTKGIRMAFLPFVF
jgi:hypothetical protein